MVGGRNCYQILVISQSKRCCMIKCACLKLKPFKDKIVIKKYINCSQNVLPPALSPLATAVRIAIVSLTLAHGTAQAATIEVDSNLDDGTDCTLRDAIVSMNNGALESGCINTGSTFDLDDTISFAAGLAGDTITLENGQLSINPGISVKIDATAVDGVTVDANGQSRVFDVDGATLAINNLIVTGGEGQYGGGIFAHNSSSIEVSNSTLTKNTAGVRGGAISLSENSSANIDNSTLSANSASAGGGVSATSSSANITNSNLYRHKVSGSGGSVYAQNSAVEITNSTLTNSSAGNSGGIIHATGLESVVNVQHGTMFGGYSYQNSSSIATFNSASVNFSNSIFFGLCRSDRSGTVTSDSASVGFNFGCSTFFRSESNPSYDYTLYEPADNGCLITHATPIGQACVLTSALITGSVALDSALASNVTTDQLGTPRPQGTAPDVGAYERLIVSDVGFSLTATEAIEGKDSTVLFTITLDEPNDEDVTYEFRTEAGTAIDGEDYVGRSGRAFFPAGVTVRERRVSVIDGGISADESNEFFSLVVTNMNDPAATIKTEAIIREIFRPKVSVDEVRVREGVGKAELVLTLSRPLNDESAVSFRTFTPVANHPAVDGEDYIGREGRVYFRAGETRKTRTFPIVTDNIREANEVFKFELSQPSRIEIAGNSKRVKIFILNDD